MIRRSFKVGGLLIPGADKVHIQVGKNPDGCWYIDLRGPTGATGNIRSVMTPLQMWQLVHPDPGAYGLHVGAKAAGPGQLTSCSWKRRISRDVASAYQWTFLAGLAGLLGRCIGW